MTRYATSEDRFWRKVDKRGPDECWPWLGGLSAGGYGHAIHEKRQIAAHRLALTFALDRPLLPSELACHRCDNRPCCNPAHLFVGSIADNNRDMYAKGRDRHRGPGYRHLTVPEIAAIQEARARGERIAGLATQYGVCQETIRRVNRLVREGEVYVRRRVFPVRDDSGWIRERAA